MRRDRESATGLAHPRSSVERQGRMRPAAYAMTAFPGLTAHFDVLVAVQAGS